LDPALLLPAALAGVVTASALHVMLTRARLPLDRPNERSLHSTPMPRSGGLALVPAILLAWLTLPTQLPWQIWASLVALFAVSVIDDARGLPVVLRFTCHLAAAAVVVFTLLGGSASVVALMIAVLGIAWMINLYNFMDGSDGLAGGMALIGFGAYGLGAWLSGDTMLAAASWAISGAAIGFLIYNFHPARVFLGDAGSIPLGLLAGTLGLLGWARESWPIWFPVLVFSPFIVDATVTLVRRLLRAERIWQAHREHYYQRLVRCGWGHRRTALVEYAWMGGCSLIALIALSRSTPLRWGLILLCTLAYAISMVLIDRRWQRHAQES
jgi:UDP-N-acetylmuramyl pentapeptide phosphotransferase/UDP-N-acetylglucosamine-1-phosphate transferase